MSMCYSYCSGGAYHWWWEREKREEWRENRGEGKYICVCASFVVGDRKQQYNYTREKREREEGEIYVCESASCGGGRNQ